MKWTHHWTVLLPNYDTGPQNSSILIHQKSLKPFKAGPSQFEEQDLVLMQDRIQLLEQLENRPIKLRAKIEQDKIIRDLSSIEKEMFLDLRPFMQRSPYLVQSDASLTRAYRLFRTMGLRHMFVSQPQPKVNNFSN